MTRAEFIAGGEQRLNYLLQQVEREAAARRDYDSTGAEVRNAQIKLASAKSEFLDFLADALKLRQRRAAARPKSVPDRALPFFERYERRIEPEPNTGCMLWAGRVNSNGYGVVTRRGRQIKAHRLAWESVHGGIPRGLVVMHSCDTPACVSLAHLSLGTTQQNTADRDRKGRHWPPMVPAPVDMDFTGLRCREGHELTQESAYVRSRGNSTWTECRICKRAARRRYRDRKRVQAPPIALRATETLASGREHAKKTREESPL